MNVKIINRNYRSLDNISVEPRRRQLTFFLKVRYCTQSCGERQIVMFFCNGAITGERNKENFYQTRDLVRSFQASRILSAACGMH